MTVCMYTLKFEITQLTTDITPIRHIVSETNCQAVLLLLTDLSIEKGKVRRRASSTILSDV